MPVHRRIPLALCVTAVASLTVPFTGAVAATTASANLVVNPSFETGTSSWYAEKGATIRRISGGYVGKYAARLSAATTGPVSLNDSPDTVLSTVQRATYAATAYLRTPNPGAVVSLRLKEFNGATVHGQTVRKISLGDTAWHKVTLTYVAKTADSRIGMNVAADRLARGRSFDVDNVSLTLTHPSPVITDFTAVLGTPAHSRVALAWAARDAVRYEVYSTGSDTPVYSGPATDVVLPVDPSTAYSFTLRAVGADGQVVTSAPVTVTTPARPPAVTDFTAVPGTPGHSQVALAWAATDAVHYEVYRAGSATPVYSGSATRFEFAAEPSTTYTFTLRAAGADGQAVTSAPVTVTTQAVPQPQWSRVYRNDFADLRDVTSFQSSASTNSTLKPTDTGNSLLQKPTVKSNVQVVADSATADGKALGVYTRQAPYPTNTGTQFGWANGRMAISGHNEAPPVRIRARLRLTASAKAKSAVMWWPAKGWPWEVDFAETFGGTTMTTRWGSRQVVGQRWHGDPNGDGKAIEQLFHDDELDATKYHVYDLFVTPSRMWIEIDGVKTFETTNQNYIPHGEGFFSVGKALTHSRDAADRTNDAVIVDYVEIYKLT